MISGRFIKLNVDDMSAKLQVEADDLETARTWVKSAMGKSVNITMSAQAVLTGTAKPQILHLQLKDPFSGHVSISRNRRTTDQNDTLRGIERMIFFAQNGREPMKGETTYIHEGVLDLFSPRVENPVTGKTSPKRTSDESMTTVEMSRIIQGAMLELAEQDIPGEVYEAVGTDMKQLWAEWYAWRDSDEKAAEELREEDDTYASYAKTHPVCEITLTPATVNDPLEIAHIASRGSRADLIEEPWNWLRIKKSLHTRQHNEGWEAILKNAPERVIKKIERAKELAGGQDEQTERDLDIF